MSFKYFCSIYYKICSKYFIIFIINAYDLCNLRPQKYLQNKSYKFYKYFINYMLSGYVYIYIYIYIFNSVNRMPKSFSILKRNREQN